MRSSTELTADPSAPAVPVDLNVVSPGYFETIGIPLVQGRNFHPSEQAGTPQVIIINQRTADTFWPGASPIGRQLRTRDGHNWEVIGIVPDRKLRNFRAGASPAVYRSVFQDPRREMTLQIRTGGNPLMLASSLPEAVRQVAPGVPLLRIATMQTHLENAVARERMTAALAGTLSVLAAVLLCVGLYGLISFHVLCRTREIGVRMALGARSGQVLLLILKQGALLLLLGVSAGVPLSLAAARLSSRLLYGVSPADGVSLLVGGSILLAAGIVATLIPAWRAARIDPASALRRE
jgi:predicted permease